MSENRNAPTLAHVKPGSGPGQPHAEQATGLVKFQAAKVAIAAALAEAKRIDDVMGIRLKVEQLELFAKQAKDRDLIADAMELQLTAERRLGELLIVAKETGQLSQGGRPRTRTGSGPAQPQEKTGSPREQVLASLTLKEAGIDRKLSMKAQQLAAYDDDRFEDVLQAARDKIKAGGAVVVNPIRDLKTGDKQILRAIKEAQLAARQKALPDKKFGVILADPEWPFEVWSPAGMDRSADNHYPTSALEVIEARPVEAIAHDDAVMFLWVTAPHHAAGNGAMIMRAWGFSPKAEIIWDKVEVGNGFWFRNQHEILLVGTRGSVPAPAAGTQWPSIVRSPKGAHSEKPDWAYGLIEQYYPALGKIELNARRRRDGWDAWGFEAPDDIRSDDPIETPDAGAHPASCVVTVDFDERRAAEGSSPDEVAADAEIDASLVGSGGIVGDGEGGGVDPATLPDPAAPAGSGPGQPPADDPLNAAIRAAYAVNTPLAEIMQATGLSKDAVKSRAKRMGIGSRDRQRQMASAFTTQQNMERRAAE